MAAPAIITVAITGAVPTKKDNPAVPVTPEEQVRSAVEAFDAGATVCHVHVRDSEQRPSSDPGLFAEVRAGIKDERPDMVVQFSTGARGRDTKERFACLELCPEMASLATGSVNFPDRIYDNSPQLVRDVAGRMLELGIKPEIEVFDFAMLYSAIDLLHEGLLSQPLHVQLVMGIRNALPARETIAEFFFQELLKLLPMSTFTFTGTGRFQLEANKWSLMLGGHIRTGLEDNLYFEKGKLASSNAELVARAADLCQEYDRYPASPKETRRLLGLSPVPTELSI